MASKARKPAVGNRRSGDETRTLILRAAAHLFRKQGFARTGTRDIAARAGVPERLLYRHFGTKRQLFQQVASAPLNEFVRHFIEYWDDREAQSLTLDDVSLKFVDGLMQLFAKNHRLIIDLVSGDIDDNPTSSVHVGSRLFNSLFENLTKHGRHEAAQLGTNAHTLSYDIRLAFALVLSVSLFGNLLFMGKPPSRRQQVEEIARFIVRGTSMPGALTVRS